MLVSGRPTLSALSQGVWGGLQAFGCCVSPPSSAKCQVNDVLQRAPTLSGMSLRVLIEESTALAALSNDQADVVRLLVSRGLVDRAWALHEAVGGSDMIAQIETLEMLLQEFWRVDPSKLDWNDDAAIQQQLGIDFSLQRGVIGFDGAVDSPVSPLICRHLNEVGLERVDIPS